LRAKQSLADQADAIKNQNKEYSSLKSSFETKLATVESKTEYFSERNGIQQMKMKYLSRC
jgi:hypothetical protein